MLFKQKRGATSFLTPGSVFFGHAGLQYEQENTFFSMRKASCTGKTQKTMLHNHVHMDITLKICFIKERTATVVL